MMNTSATCYMRAMWRSVVISLVAAGCEWGGGTDATGLHAADAPPGSDAHASDGHASDGRAASDGATTDAVDVDGAVTIDAPASACASPITGMIATWTFTSETGSQTSTSASATGTGITAGVVARVGVTAASGAGSINSTSWPTTAMLDAAKYYTLSVTPPAGCALDLTSLAIDAKASASGPSSAALATSADAFAGTVAVSTSAPSTPALSVTGATAAVELRVYGFSAASAAGTFRIQTTLTLSGALH